MSVKSKRRERKRKAGKAAPDAVKNKDKAPEEETYTLNAILADFRANKELEQAAEGIKPVKDTDFDNFFDMPTPERVEEEAAETAVTAKRAEVVTDAAEEVTETPLDASATREVEDAPFHAFTAEEVAETSAEETPFDTFRVMEESVEKPFDLSEAARIMDGIGDDLDAPSAPETAEEVTETPIMETAVDFVKTDNDFDAFSMETPFGAFTAESVTETPTETIMETEIGASATESLSEIIKAESVTETPLDASAEEMKAEEGAETPPDISATEKVTETEIDASAPETPFDLSKAASVMDDADRVSDTASASEAEPNAPDLSETQTFSRVTSAKPAAPTLRQRLFGRAKKRDDSQETKEDAAPRSISLEEVVGNTVDAVKADAVLESGGARRSLFSRRRLEDTEEASDERPEIIGPEPNLKTAAEQARREYVRRIDGLLPAIAPAVLPALVLLLETLGVRFPFLTESVFVRPLLLLACLGATLWFCRTVFADHPCSAAFLCGVSAIAAALDCLTMPFFPGRSMAEPYGAVACLALLSAKVGSSLESHGVYDAFHAAGLSRNPSYLVTDTVNGARKRRGGVTGFYTAALSQNFSHRSQTLFLPVMLAASLVFAALSSVGQERGWDFFLNWSAILAAGATLVLPLCWGLPWARLASRLKNSGAAVAGWRGAEQLARKRKMIVTDSDLFPPGSVRITDTRIYEEDMPTVVSITASVIRESGCGLERVFDDLLKSEGGNYLPVRDFHFYEDGGFSGTIQENKILLGTSSFLRKMSVRFPGDFYFPMGLYLSIDGELSATFALKYDAMENVDYALRLMRRNHVTAILAARDPNLTPKLLQRVFRRKIDVEYPGLNNRIALSDMRKSRDLPRGLLFREGLPPYAEMVTGSMRLRAGVRRATLLSLFGSAVGTLLAFYLVYQAKYYLFSPLNLLLFLLLWTAPAVLLMDLS